MSACSGWAPASTSGTYVFADQAALADVDQLLGRLALLRIELVLGRDAVEVLENAIPKVAAVADFEEQAIETVGLGRRMLVELVSAILELEAAVSLHGFRRLIAPAREGMKRIMQSPWCQVGM